MSGKGKTAFRPVTEAIEGRILAAAGQAWVEIANQSGRNLSFQISFNEGRTYSNESLRNGASTFAHVNRNDPDVLIRLRGASPVVLATGPSKQAAPSYTITPTNAGGMTVAPAPVSNSGGGSTGRGVVAGGGGGVGVGVSRLPQSYVVILNQSGEDVSLAFTNNNGRNFLDLTIGQGYFSLMNPFIVSLDQTRSGIKILRPNGGGLEPLGSSPILNSAPVYIIDASLNVFPS